MKKFNFSESEKAFQKAAEVNSIQKLLRLADSVSSEKSSENSENRAAVAKRIEELHNEIKSLKEHHSEIYFRLHLTSEEETIILSHPGTSEEERKKLAVLQEIFERSKKEFSPETEEGLNDQISVKKEIQKKIKKLKETDLDLYQKLSLSPAEEEEIFSDSRELFEATPEKLLALKDRLDRLNKDPDDKSGKDTVLEDQISLERREHVNKRLNVRKGWLPLK